MPARIRRDDEVVLLAGKDRGRTGRVMRLVPATNKVVVEGCNMIKRHQRPRPGTNDAGGIIEREAPVHLSNVALLDPTDNRPTRIRFEEQGGVRVRVSVRSGERV